MKKLIAILLPVCLLLSGCGKQAADSTQTSAKVDSAAVSEIDLTQMSGTMVYSYVYNIVNTPQEYEGQCFRIQGTSDASYWDETDTTYHYIVIADATACCAQGLEFILSDGHAQYPEAGANIEIRGVLEPYMEEDRLYYHIVADEIRVL